MKDADRLTLAGVFVNAVLFILKSAAALASGSLAVASDALNSLLDIVSYTLIYISVRVSRRKADSSHPFGHQRAEPLAAVVVAIFAGILGFEVIKQGVFGVLDHGQLRYTLLPVVVLSITIAAKTIMYYHYRTVGRRLKSPAILAGSVDSRNDVLVSATALLGYVGATGGLPLLDEVAGIIIGVWIIKSGYDIGVKNVDYLMGKAPGDETMTEIRSKAESVEGVIRLNTVRAHYVGNYVQVEVHIEVDKNMPTQDSHAISKKVQGAVEKLPHVNHAFIHVDPT